MKAYIEERSQHEQIKLIRKEIGKQMNEKINEEPTREIKYDSVLMSYTKDFGITYKQLMEACDYVVENDIPADYPGNLNIDELDIELYDLWSYWSDKTGYDFPNYGSACCPEYEYPKYLFSEK